MEADKIYVRELETNLEQMTDEARTDVEKEELEREKEALQEEKTKIAQKEKELEKRKKEIDEDMKKRLQELQVCKHYRCVHVNNTGVSM